MNDRTSIEESISDEELTRLALSADRYPVIDANTMPWRPGGDAVTGLLPDWYMPAPSGRRRGRGAQVAIGVIIASFVIINALGLCITYGFLTLA
ncbi:MAG: hypothetical protein PXZ08_11290 [Actinomycetota bacterium]|jgi:hypothetical protein|nr:hypothetical protein [Actinomycetota bacterium]